jgi:hypothetical protein
VHAGGSRHAGIRPGRAKICRAVTQFTALSLSLA